MRMMGSFEIRKMVILALLLGAGIVLYVIEYLYLPVFPIPGVRLGLANIVTLFLIVFFSWKECFFNAIARTVVGSIITGSFFTPAFIFSLSGAFVSILIMLIVYNFFYGKLSLVGVSVAGATSHNITQLLLAATLFVKHWGILFQVPLLLFVAIATGTINGVIANLFVKKAALIPIFGKVFVANARLREYDE